MNIFGIIAPLIIVALLGFICAKRTWLSESQFSGLSKVTFTLFIPAFLFYKMATADLTSQLQPALFLSFYLPVLLCYALAWYFNHKWHNEHANNQAASSVFALGASYSNTIIVGLPILLLVIGEQTLPIIFLIVTFHSAMLFALTSALALTKQQVNWRNFIKQTLCNPLVFAILSGLMVNNLAIDFPTPIAKSLTLLGQPAITLALFALGASIARYDIRGERKFIAIACTIKLLILPLLVYLTASKIFMLEPLVTNVLVVLSACPTGINAYIIAQSHQVHRKAVASTVVVSTLAATITIPFWLAISHIN